MSLLVYLYEHRDRVVNRDELMTEVWGKRYLTDHSISVAVAVLRRALGDEASQPQYIKTVYKKGYRLIADAAAPDKAFRPAVYRWSMIVPFAITLLAVVVVSTLVVFRPVAGNSVPLILVNDFVSETGDAGDDQLASTLTDVLVAELARDPGARVQKRIPGRLLLPLSAPAEESRFQKEHSASVTGRLLREGADTRLVIYLEDGQTSEIVWSGEQAVDRTNCLATAREVSRNLLANVIPQRPFVDMGSASTDAVRLTEMVQLARNLAGIRSHATKRSAHSLLLRALEIDPDYGPAHSLLAFLHAQEGLEYWGLDDVVLRSAEEELVLARRFGSNEAHNLATEALMLSVREGRFDRAIELMDMANQLAPDDPWVLRMNLATDIVSGDFALALDRNMDAARLSVDPSSVLAERVVPLYFAGRYEEAIELYEATRELDLLPVFHGPQAAVLAGESETGFRLWIDLLRVHDVEFGDPRTAQQQAAAGDVRSAYEWLAAEFPANPSGRNAPLIQASWLIAAGRPDEAMDVLLAGARRMYSSTLEAPAPTFLWATIQHDPIFRPLQDDERMTEVVDIVSTASMSRDSGLVSAAGGLPPRPAQASE